MILRIFTQITSSFSGNTRTTLLSQENFADEKEKTLFFFRIFMSDIMGGFHCDLISYMKTNSSF